MLNFLKGRPALEKQCGFVTSDKQFFQQESAAIKHQEALDKEYRRLIRENIIHGLAKASRDTIEEPYRREGPMGMDNYHRRGLSMFEYEKIIKGMMSYFKRNPEAYKTLMEID